MILCFVGDDESEDKSEDKREDGGDDGQDKAEKNFAFVEKYIKKHGVVDIPSLKLYLIGPPGVGKTTTRKRLTGEIKHVSPNEKGPSTGIDAPVTVQIGKTTTRERLTGEIKYVSPNEKGPSTGIDAPVTVQIDDVLINDEWKSQGLEEQCQALCSCILKVGGEDNTAQQTANNVQENSNELPIPPAFTEQSPALMISDPVEATNSVKNPEHFVPTNSAEISDTVSVDDESPSPSGDSIISSRSRQDHKEYELSSELRSLVKERNWIKIGEFLRSKNFTLLQIIDIGGQPEFHAIIPLLLHGLAINLIFLDMSQGMDSKYEVSYRGRDGSVDSTIQYESEFTVRELIDCTLSNISSLQSNDSVDSVAILVGTHCDSHRCNEEHVSALEESVRNSFATFIRNGVLLQVNNESPEKYIHQVNNVSGVSDIVSLRKLISNSVHRRFKSKPVLTTTLLLHLILRNKFGEKGWCWLNPDCVEIAKVLGIEEDLTEKDGVLQYLHDRFGTILYYQGKTRQGKKTELKISQRVIVDPDVIMRPPVELVVTAFGAEGNDPPVARRIRFTGEISHSVMEKACEKYWPSDDKKKLIPTDEIVELLESRYILHDHAKPADAENGDETVYFLPCLLSFDEGVRGQSRDHSQLDSLTYPPLLVIPKKEYIPHGLFPATIVKLSQQEHWELFETKIPTQIDAKQTRFRNRIHFTFKKLDVELRALPTHLECRILSDGPRDKSIDCQISECRSELEKYIDEVLLSLFPTKKWIWNFGFYCPKALSNKIPPHPAPLNKEQMIACNTLGCIELQVGLEEKHKIWFTTSKDEASKQGKGTVFNVTHDYFSHAFDQCCVLHAFFCSM